MDAAWASGTCDRTVLVAVRRAGVEEVDGTSINGREAIEALLPKIRIALRARLRAQARLTTNSKTTRHKSSSFVYPPVWRLLEERTIALQKSSREEEVERHCMQRRSTRSSFSREDEQSKGRLNHRDNHAFATGPVPAPDGLAEIWLG